MVLDLAWITALVHITPWIIVLICHAVSMNSIKNATPPITKLSSSMKRRFDAKLETEEAAHESQSELLAVTGYEGHHGNETNSFIRRNNVDPV
jgi:hypothetical protein